MLRIGIAYTLKPDDPGGGGPDDRFEEFDKPETIEALAEAIRGDGHDVVLLGDGREFLGKMLADPPDFVFNIAEGQGTGRDREARVPCVCEMLGVPCSGSDPLTLAACLDKSVAKQLLQSLANSADNDFALGTPKGIVIPAGSSRLVLHMILADFLPREYPVILKPLCEGSSKGIRGACLADDQAQAIEQASRLAIDYGQDILVEQFINGDELTVGLVGSGESATVLGIMRIIPNQPVDRFVYSLEVKRDWANQVRYEAPAQLSAQAMEAVTLAAELAYSQLECRDVARLDFRLHDGRPYFIEANPLPGLAPVTSDLVILAEGYGIAHGDLVRNILRAGLARVGLGAP